jgi:hypothetical protein
MFDRDEPYRIVKESGAINFEAMARAFAVPARTRARLHGLRCGARLQDHAEATRELG